MDETCTGCGRDVFGPAPGENAYGIGNGFIKLEDALDEGKSGFWHAACLYEAERAIERGLAALKAEGW
jgi:hypothetical protein